MSIVGKHCLVWTLLLAVSVQGIAAVLSSVRGPAHFHAAASPAQAPDAGHEPAPSSLHHAHSGNHHGAGASTLRVGHFQAVQALAAGHAQAAHSPHRALHSLHHHDQVHRHYHLPGSDAVLVQDESHNDPSAPAQRTSRGESVSPAFVGVISKALMLPSIDAGVVFAISHAKKLASCCLKRIERPPRPLSA